jgi:hypothetical protein
MQRLQRPDFSSSSSFIFEIRIDEERGHTAMDARVTHLLHRVGEVEVLELLPNRLTIVDPLDLDDRSTDANDPILDILAIPFE